jgi:hypothetical protein
VVIDVDKTAGATTGLVQTPRAITLCRVPAEGKPVRLTCIGRQTAGQEGALADAVDGGRTLDALEPAHVFGRRYIEQ